MAMNKKEQAAFDAAQREAKLARALSWSTPMHSGPIEPDVLVPDIGKVTRGWVVRSVVTFGVNYYCVEMAASKANAHITSSDKDRIERWIKGGGYVSGSQKGIPLHSTKLRAWMSARRMAELDSAKVLLRIDEEIEAERLAAGGAS